MYIATFYTHYGAQTFHKMQKSIVKEHETITEDGIGHLVKEVKAKEFYSKKTAVITNGAEFQEKLIDYMLRRNHIQKISLDRKSVV